VRRKLQRVPDVVSPLLGRVTALVKTMVEWSDPLQETLVDLPPSQERVAVGVVPRPHTHGVKA
jgi:hypothetical protein